MELEELLMSERELALKALLLTVLRLPFLEVPFALLRSFSVAGTVPVPFVYSSSLSFSALRTARMRLR